MGQDPPAPFAPGATRRATVRVGVGVLVVSQQPSSSSSKPVTAKIYAGRRLNSHGAHKLALPGGHLELHESWRECAIREVHEEMGVPLYHVEYLHVTNDIMRDENKHYVTIFMVGYLYDDRQQESTGSASERQKTAVEPKNCEPDKCEGWHAYTLDELQSLVGQDQLFSPLEQLLVEKPTRLLEIFGTPNS